jgi:hypothetical protein
MTDLGGDDASFLPLTRLCLYSPRCLEGVCSEVAELGAHQAAHHPYHQLYGPIVV